MEAERTVRRRIYAYAALVVWIMAIVALIGFNLPHTAKIASYCMVLIGSFISAYWLYGQARQMASRFNSVTGEMRNELQERIRSGQRLPEANRALGIQAQAILEQRIVAHNATEFANGVQKDTESAKPVLCLSEKQLAERANRLAASNAELEQFAYVASHDLQEPLRKISSYARLLREECGPQLDESGHEYLDVVIGSANRLKGMVSDLLSLSRITARGKEMAQVNANDCLHAALDNLEVMIEECDARITCDLLPFVFADEGQLVLVFENLISNAIKYRGDSLPEIHVGGRDSGDQYEFFVRDNGIGIESRFYGRVFEIFQRLHSRREFNGTGIGLALCKRIVERCGGTIWVDSTPGRGSTFFFTINKAVRPKSRDIEIQNLRPVAVPS